MSAYCVAHYYDPRPLGPKRGDAPPNPRHPAFVPRYGKGNRPPAKPYRNPAFRGANADRAAPCVLSPTAVESLYPHRLVLSCRGTVYRCRELEANEDGSPRCGWYGEDLKTPKGSVRRCFECISKRGQ